MKKSFVDSYIQKAPPESQGKLIELRNIIKTCVPKAEEKMSYGMPSYSYKGQLVYFAFAKKHVGLYIPPPVIVQHQRELQGYETATATVRFPLDKKLPSSLIKKLVKARMKINEERFKKKK